MVWGPPSTDEDHESEVTPAMVVIVQPPWVLSLHDLELFTGCERVSPLRLGLYCGLIDLVLSSPNPNLGDMVLTRHIVAKKDYGQR